MVKKPLNPKEMEINHHLALALIGATGKVREHIEAAQEALNKKKDKKLGR